MPTVRQMTLTSRGHELDHLAPFGEKDMEHHGQNHFFFFSTFFNTRKIFVTDVGKFFRDRYWNFITMSNKTTYADSRSGYLRLLQFFLLIPVTPIVKN